MQYAGIGDTARPMTVVEGLGHAEDAARRIERLIARLASEVGGYDQSVAAADNPPSSSLVTRVASLNDKLNRLADSLDNVCSVIAAEPPANLQNPSVQLGGGRIASDMNNTRAFFG